MAFTLPTRDELRTEISSLIRGKRADAAMGPGSDGATLRDTLTHLVSGLHLHLRYGVLHQMLPTKASGIYLSAWAWLFGLPDGSGGLGRIVARGSSASDSFTFTATGATADLQDEEFQDSAGNIYKIDESYTFLGAGSATLDVAAVDTGAATNVKVSDAEVFTWLSTPANMSDTITQAADLAGGADDELDAALRARLAMRLQTPAQGGNWAQYRDWIEAVSPGQLRGYIWPKREGYGCVDYLVVYTDGTGHTRYVDPALEMGLAVEAAIDENAPVLQALNARQLGLTPSAASANVTVVVTLADNARESRECDWDAETIRPAVVSSTVLTKLIEADVNVCAPTVTGGIEVGHEVIIGEDLDLGTKSASAIVSAVNVDIGAGADPAIFEVTTWPDGWGAVDDAIAAEPIMSGGGTIQAGIDSIRDLADTLGPAKGTTAAPMDDWEDELRLIAIRSAVIQASPGVVVDVVVETPIADAAPTAGTGTTEEMVLVYRILVYEDKS